MLTKTSLVVLTLAIGMLVGFTFNQVLSSQTASAQASQQILVQGHGRAISSLRPPGEQFTFTAWNDPQRSFKVLPVGKKLVLTDIMYISQGNVRQDLVVNIANANPANQTHDILFQIRVSPDESPEVHLCSGYVIASEHALVAFTNAGPAPEQYVSISVTGYLADE